MSKGEKTKKPIFKKWWFWVIVVVVVVAAVAGGGSASDSSSDRSNQPDSSSEVQTVVSTQNPAKSNADENVPTEYKSALKKAQVYSDTMNMSKVGIYNQLTSEYGEKFSNEAAQYSMENYESD